MFRGGHLIAFTMLCAMILLAGGCRTGYYAVMEKFGQHKRDLLRQSLSNATEQQKEVEQQFSSTLERLQELTGASGGELQERYEAFRKDYEASKTEAERVGAHIREVEHVAGDLFAEWESELEEIQNQSLRQRSRSKLNETRTRFEKMRRALVRSEEAMEPVLAQMKDYVLYLKHNLNAQAIGSLQDEKFRIEEEIGRLIMQMNKSVSEAEEFIQILENEAGTVDK